MLGQSAWLAGISLTGKIVGTCDHDPPNLAYAPCHQARLGQGPKPNRNIETFRDQIQVAIGKHKLHANGAMDVDKARYDGNDMLTAEDSGCRYAQHAAQISLADIGSFSDSRAVVTEKLARAVSQPAACFGWGEMASRPLHKSNPDPLFNRSKRSGHGWCRTTKAPSCGSEAAGVENCREHLQLVETIHG
jgi:hypothetical protein